MNLPQMTTSKRPTGGGSRQISLRFYVYTSTLTQCTFDRPTSHSFHGSNSSNSKDNGLVVFWCCIICKLIEGQIGWTNVQHSKLCNKVCCPIEVLSCPGLDKRQLRKREIEHDFGDFRWRQRNAESHHNNSCHCSAVRRYPSILNGPEECREVNINYGPLWLVETNQLGEKKQLLQARFFLMKRRYGRRPMPLSPK